MPEKERRICWGGKAGLTDPEKRSYYVIRHCPWERRETQSGSNLHRRLEEYTPLAGCLRRGIRAGRKKGDT